MDPIIFYKKNRARANGSELIQLLSSVLDWIVHNISIIQGQAATLGFRLQQKCAVLCSTSAHILN